MALLYRFLFLLSLLGLVSGHSFAQSTAATPPASSAKIEPSVKKLAPVPSNNSRVRTLNDIIASVDGSVITRIQMEQKTQSILKRMQSQGVLIPKTDDLQKQVLERVIIEIAQLNLAKTRGIKLDNAQVQAALTNIAMQNKLSVDEFQKRLVADGITIESFKEELRNDILIKRVQDREVGAKVRISEADIEQFLSQDSKNTQELNLAQILVQTPEGLSAEAIEQKRLRAEDAWKRLSSGEDFTRIAVEFSDSADALKGGELGWRSVNKIPGAFVDAVQALKVGELSKVVRSANGFHILKVLGRRDNAQSAQKVQQTRARHILIKTTPLVSARQAQTKIQAVKSKLDKQEATFEILAQQYSDDSSKNKGGDLGVLFPGDTVPAFEGAMNKLEIGAISEPIRTEFGYHLIQVLERKTDVLPASRKELQARVVLYERKYEEALIDWLSQLRGQVHVETFVKF